MSPQLGQGANMALMDACVLGDVLASEPSTERALSAYNRTRRQHVGIYQFISRWLTPLFQSDTRWLAPLRDACFAPFGRLPFARPQMLKILAGTKRSWWR
jgi:2-polyprenyl-6-methoxyphenol hydroxylase-like FAD-dependent oxidoreductase